MNCKKIARNISFFLLFGTIGVQYLGRNIHFLKINKAHQILNTYSKVTFLAHIVLLSTALYTATTIKLSNTTIIITEDEIDLDNYSSDSKFEISAELKVITIGIAYFNYLKEAIENSNIENIIFLNLNNESPPVIKNKQKKQIQISETLKLT